MEKTVVLYPGLAVSHFLPMMQLVDVLQEEGYAVVVALIDATMEWDVALAAAVGRVASSKPSATFHVLPRIQDPPAITNDVNLLLGYLELLRRYNKHLGEFLSSLPPRSIHAVVVDSLSNVALDVTKELGVPAYSFFTSNASALAVFLQLPQVRKEQSFKELGDATLHFHGVPPMPASHLMDQMLEDPESEIYKATTESHCKNLEADGILVNTFASLEARAVYTLTDPQFLCESELTMPPVYFVGPLVQGPGAVTDDETQERHECLAWLDEQPDHSVVFLCFGGVGSGNYSEVQLKEIAAGLQRSGHRFLWVVRAPLGENPERQFGVSHADPDLHMLLPQGFLERTKGRVPMLCWPLYAEQRMNKVFMAEEAGIGVEVIGWQQGLVEAEEVEAKVKLVLGSEEGEKLRARVMAHKQAASMAWKNGGSSRTVFGKFLSDAATTAMKKTMVLYPGLAVSHLVPMMQLADALLEEGYAVTVTHVDPILKGDIALATVFDRVASSRPSVTFHKLPRIQDPPAIFHDARFLVTYSNLISRHSKHLHEYLRSIPPRSVRALLVDFMCTDVFDVAQELGIPAYSFVPMNASGFALFCQLPSIFTAEGQPPSLKQLGGDSLPLDLHGVRPGTITASHIDAEGLEDPENRLAFAVMMATAQQKANGVLVNTFLSLEARAVGALRDPRCFPTMPPVYCVGPLVAEAGQAYQADEKKHECLSWLDKQPERSVVYLCFGSVGAGSHSEEQLREIAIGLEESGHRFLWVVRAPPHHNVPRSDPDLHVILPEGFLDRTSGRGLVVKLWAPQLEVLRHRATGAFVTHCGWNSVLEGITAGVPMICWPLYAEQKMNMVLLVKEARIGVEMLGWQQGRLVKAEEVEAKVRLVIESEEGELLRERVTALKEAAAMAMKDCGSSRVAFGQLLSDVGNRGLG
ncbi:hypothetical protein HU200_018943 [Digitaria exilis]|uniref:UDP-glycosyltransferases domain-containing protein n=1 Tax=Digitaria exilis TaxID=1010633 RepID=A0A835F3L3_9POAL|nr:hypothetical protein HU200_018943 [Digitaria exilis]